MGHSPIRHYGKLISLLGVFSLGLGCAHFSNGPETMEGEGFHDALPQPGTRVIVRGNHSEAVNHALHWLNDHQLLVVNRRVEKDLIPQGATLREKPTLQAHESAAAHKAGATLVVFVHADETPLSSPADTMSVAHQPMKTLGVEIQGMNADTGKVAFGAKAWGSQPLDGSDERAVQDLTILALEKAWQEPETSRSRQEIVTPAIKTEQEPPLLAPSPEKAPEAPTLIAQSTAVPAEPADQLPVSQPAAVDSPANSRKQVTVFTETVPEEGSPAPEETQAVRADPSSSSEDSSVGLHIASGALSLVYTPLKVVYAALGGIVGGFVYVLTGGNDQAAQSVWDASLRGTYWVTPDHLQGNEPVRFKGDPAP